MPLEERASWLLRQLADRGVRLTDTRMQVVRAIADAAGPIAPEQLATCLRQHGIGRATVYRTLDLLERLSLLARISIGSSHGYTVCEDGRHHHHLVCGSCSAVVPVKAERIEAEIQRLAQRMRIRIATHVLEFSGECARCVRQRAQRPHAATA